MTLRNDHLRNSDGAGSLHMGSLEEKLESLGLGQYLNVLIDNGFEDWDTVLEIIEDDIDELGIKLGHRRILQQEIAACRKYRPTPNHSCRPTSTSVTRTTSPTLNSPGRRRRYRWHPRPDPNAPKKPKTAYVNFANHLRTDPAIASKGFVEIAREVGQQWQNLDASEKKKWESVASAAMEEYEKEMESYRRTKKFQEHQQYLEAFKKAPTKRSQQLRAHSAGKSAEESLSTGQRVGGISISSLLSSEGR